MELGERIIVTKSPFLSEFVSERGQEETEPVGSWVRRTVGFWGSLLWH